MAILTSQRRGQLALVALWTMLGCGDPLLDKQFRGVPLASFSGDTQIGGTVPSDPAPLRLALFFSATNGSTDAVENLLELTASTMEITAPSLYQMHVFAPPSESMLQRTPSGTRYAIGRMLIYRDRNEDGRRQPDEPLVGIDPPRAIVYAESAIPAGEMPSGGAFASGFSPVLLPQICQAMRPQPRAAVACEVLLGDRCASDADCNPKTQPMTQWNGSCLRETKMPWPAGYCVVEVKKEHITMPERLCQPGPSVYYSVPRYALKKPETMGYFLRACQRDADCNRVGDRDDGVYACDPGLRACRPQINGGKIGVFSRFEVEPFCAAP